MKLSSILVFTLSIASPLLAGVRLPHILSDGMVLQRNVSAPIWGKAAPGEKVSVTFAGQTKSAVAGKDGRWRINLDAMKASAEPREMTINNVKISDILVGEVWLSAGQSNLEMNLQILPEDEKKVVYAQKNNKLIRMYVTPEHYNLAAPIFFSGSRNAGYWSKTSDFMPKLAKDQLGPWYTHGSVPFFFLMKLQKTLGVPVAVLDIAWGGTPVERWISDEGFAQTSEEYRKQTRYAPVTDEQKKKMADFFKKIAPKAIAWSKAAQEAAKHGEFNPFPYDKIRYPGVKAVNDIYNGMIFPIVPFAVKGTIWYQGEHNYRSKNYYQGLQGLIGGWRKVFNNADMPFILIMIAPFNGYGKDGAEAWQMCDNVWAAEMKAAAAIENCYAFPIHDTLGPKDDVSDIHPPWKLKVGLRTADTALRYVYDKKDIPAGGLRFAGAKRDGAKVIVSFKGIDQGLEKRDGKELGWFELSADNKTFIKASARISGRTAVVSSDKLADPKYVRMGWRNIATPNLQDKSGIPAFPFASKKID